MKNCWEIKQCGREAGGAKVAELGECIASRQQLGHSCWAIAGTLCGGEVQGDIKDKQGNCLTCEVYELYNRMTGTARHELAAACPEEEALYCALIRHR
ncbi:MAG: hypothetical protein JSU82_13870 [Rhodospirillales bacterium]|nr:MAG: hypothetical protein JSU82_13870 [Rhodospirillales bacterium]